MDLQTIERTAGPADQLRQAAKIVGEIKTTMEQTDWVPTKDEVGNFLLTLTKVGILLWSLVGDAETESKLQIRRSVTNRGTHFNAMLNVIMLHELLYGLQWTDATTRWQVISNTVNEITTELDLLAKKLDAIADTVGKEMK